MPPDLDTWITRGVAVLSLVFSVISLLLYYRREIVMQPRIGYTVAWLDNYPGTGGGLSLAVHRVETPGPVNLKWGCRVLVRSRGGKSASNIQVRATATGGALIVQAHTNDSRLVERLPDIGRQGSPEVSVTIPLMVPGEEAELTFWYGIPNSPTKPQPLTVLVRHAEGLGQPVRR